MTRFVLTLRCQDQPGIVRAVADGVVAVGGNITDSAQFGDPTTALFALRCTFDVGGTAPIEALRWVVQQRVEHLDPVLGLRRETDRRRILVLVSQLDHCLVDLLYRWRIGELPVDIAAVVSNHTVCAPEVERAGLLFLHVPVTPESKPAAEARLLELVDQHRVDLVVLARYMQILSPEVCQRLPERMINIHHSFLPGFAGARPYHQAHQRGVKLVGATAHYVTADLDQGPIIDQDVVRVGHAQSAEDLVGIGRDVERRVLARAVRLHAEDRVVVAGRRTIVFA